MMNSEENQKKVSSGIGVVVVSIFGGLLLFSMITTIKNYTGMNKEKEPECIEGKTC